MQPTQDRLGMDGVRFSESMARIGLWGLDMGERRIGETGTERHVRTAKIVVGNPRFQDAPQMRFRQVTIRKGKGGRLIPSYTRVPQSR